MMNIIPKYIRQIDEKVFAFAITKIRHVTDRIRRFNLAKWLGEREGQGESR